MRFLIADNQALTAAGVRLFVREAFPDAPIVGVGDKRELVAALRSTAAQRQPDKEGDVVVLDYSLFDFSGADHLLVVVSRFPQSQWLLLDSGLSETFVHTLSQEARISFIRKEDSLQELRDALHAAAEGRQYHSLFFRNLLQHHADTTTTPLTATERDVLRLIAEGKQSKEIAALRSSSVHTIITHRKNIFRKLGVNNRYEATRYAIRAGLVEPVEYYI